MILVLVFLGITVLFFLTLGVRELFSNKVRENMCSICIAVSLTWIALLILGWLRIIDDKTIVALLIGQSSLGIFYMWEKKVKENVLTFRLPFLLTLLFIGYSIIEGFRYNVGMFVFFGLLWSFFALIFAYRSQGWVGKFARKIVECCKRW